MNVQLHFRSSTAPHLVTLLRNALAVACAAYVAMPAMASAVLPTPQEAKTTTVARAQLSVPSASPADDEAPPAPEPEEHDLGFYLQATGSDQSDAGAYADGEEALAAGEAATAVGYGAAALGAGAVGYADHALAVGHNSFAGDTSASAIGGTLDLDYSYNEGAVIYQQTAATGLAATALGAGAQSSGEFNLAAGAGAIAADRSSVAIGGIVDYYKELYPTIDAVWGMEMIPTEATGALSTALGGGAQATAYNATAVGALSSASGNRSIAMGSTAVASEYAATAIGSQSEATGQWATAIGNGARAQRDNAVAIGPSSLAQNVGSTAVGPGARAVNDASVAIGQGALASAQRSIVIGQAVVYNSNPWVSPTAVFVDGIAMGNGAIVFGNQSIAIGAGAQAGSQTFVNNLPNMINNSVALGVNAIANSDSSVALGFGSVSDRVNSVSIGSAGGERQLTNVAAGTEETDAVNLAQLNQLSGDLDQRIGTIAGVAANAVGYDDQDKRQVTFAGDDGTTLNNVSAGSLSSDSMQAVNGGQLYGALDGIAGLLGGNSYLDANGLIQGTGYRIGGNDYASVGLAFGAVDTALGGLDSRLSSLEQHGGIQAGTGNGVAVGSASHAADGNDTAIGSGATVGAEAGTAVGANTAIAADATQATAVGEGASVTASGGTALGQGASVTASGAVALGQGSVATQANTVSVGSSGNERRITNLAAGEAATDAANVGQVNAGDAATLASANTYTDTTATRTLTSSKAYTDQQVNALNDRFEALGNDVQRRLGRLDERLDRQGAMSSAMLNMAINAAGPQGSRGRVAAGVGFQNGENAISVGYGKQIGERGSFSLGASFSGGDTSTGIGFGLAL